MQWSLSLPSAAGRRAGFNDYAVPVGCGAKPVADPASVTAPRNSLVAFVGAGEPQLKGTHSAKRHFSLSAVCRNANAEQWREASAVLRIYRRLLGVGRSDSANAHPAHFSSAAT